MKLTLVLALLLFALTQASDITLQNAGSKQFLDSNNDGAVYTSSPNGGAFQRWRMEDKGDGTISLQNVATGKWLDSNTAGDVYTLEGNGGRNQRWTMQAHSTTFGFTNAATGMVLITDSSGLVRTTRDVTSEIFTEFTMTPV